MTCERCGRTCDGLELGWCDDCWAADAQAFEAGRFAEYFGPFDDYYQMSVWRGWQWTDREVG